MRITQSTMYKTHVSQMNNTLGAYMESNMQGATQKKINRPSDDPVGMSRILMQRASLERSNQYLKNSQDAEGWLTSADGTLTQVQVVLNSLREKALQASDGTKTPENRKQIAAEIREMFSQLITLVNTPYAGQQMFAGHKYKDSAYQQGLGITTKDQNLLNVELDSTPPSTINSPWTVTGDATSTVMVRFVDSGTIGEDTIRYTYSKDGGKTWEEKTLNPGDFSLDLDGPTIDFMRKLDPPNPSDPDSEKYLKNNLEVTAFDPNEAIGSENGTVLYVRPAAYYQGDDTDPPPVVDMYGTSKIGSANAHGNFSGDIRIRLDSEVDVAQAGQQLKYSYSLDNGITWLQANPVETTGTGTPPSIRLQVPGGYLDVTPQTGQPLEEGQQFVIRPRRAELGLEISQGEFMSVTNSGKDIFGGLYLHNGQLTSQPADNKNKNLFETISNLIAYTECGDQDGCQEAYEDIKVSMEEFLTDVAKLGGKRNRVSLNVTLLETVHDQTTTHMSRIEDIDLTTLLTDLTRHQMSYQTVLQSSSMIMKLNLTNFI